jgi:hypothetical protein
MIFGTGNKYEIIIYIYAEVTEEYLSTTEVSKICYGTENVMTRVKRVKNNISCILLYTGVSE